MCDKYIYTVRVREVVVERVGTELGASRGACSHGLTLCPFGQGQDSGSRRRVMDRLSWIGIDVDPPLICIRTHTVRLFSVADDRLILFLK